MAIQEIDLKDFRKLMQSERIDLVDVRESHETEDEGMIEHAKHWPLSTFNKREKELSKTHPTIFYCRSGVRSLKAAEIAAFWTEQPIYSLRGGYLAYMHEKNMHEKGQCCG